MEITFDFIGKAEPLAALYEALAMPSFVASDPIVRSAAGLVVPNIGDRVSLRMLPGPDIRHFRCTARHFDFCEAAAPVLRVELDMA